MPPHIELLLDGLPKNIKIDPLQNEDRLIDLVKLFRRAVARMLPRIGVIPGRSGIAEPKEGVLRIVLSELLFVEELIMCKLLPILAILVLLTHLVPDKAFGVEPKTKTDAPAPAPCDCKGLWGGKDSTPPNGFCYVYVRTWAKDGSYTDWDYFNNSDFSLYTIQMSYDECLGDTPDSVIAICRANFGCR